MASLTGQSVAASYEQLLHVDRDGGGNTTTLVNVKDGDNGTTFAMQLSTTTICIDNPTASSATQGGILRLQSDDGAVMASGHRLGVLEFAGAEDTSSTITVGARIEALCDDTWSATENGADMVFYTTDGNASEGEVLRLTADNNVGIGTDAPATNLHVKTTAGNHGIEIESDSAAVLTFDHAGNDEARILIKEADTTEGSIIYTSTGSTDTMQFKVGSNGERMRITGGGNVGIGTASPNTRLTLNGSSGDGWLNGLELQVSGTAIGRIIGDSGGMKFRTVVSGDHYYFRNSGNTTNMIIQDGGNVGVGTVAPANPLAVNRSGDGVIVDFESADAVEGTVSISGETTSYNAFVGSHYTQLKDGQNDLPVGAVVSSTGEIITCNFVTEAIAAVESVEAVEAKDAVFDDDGNIIEEGVEAVAAVEAVEAIEATTKNVPNKEYFTYINTTTTASDPTVYGTWMGKMSDDAKGHSFGDDGKPIYLVAQVGLFKIRVTDTNGDILRGDYLESSTRAMEGQKQTSNAKVNSTIGKAMIDVDWSAIDADLDLGYKWKLIPCTF